MSTQENKWNIGEIADLRRQTVKVSKGQINSYEHLIDSKYICIREADSKNRGILLKILGKIPGDHIFIKGGEPFCKDDKDEAFRGDIYYSYRFPSVAQLKEVLSILQGNKQLLDRFEEAAMHVNPLSTFWVRDTASKLLFFKKPQFYNAKTQQISIDENTGDIHYRLTIAYFTGSEISW